MVKHLPPSVPVPSRASSAAPPKTVFGLAQNPKPPSPHLVPGTGLQPKLPTPVQLMEAPAAPILPRPVWGGNVDWYTHLNTGKAWTFNVRKVDTSNAALKQLILASLPALKTTAERLLKLKMGRHDGASGARTVAFMWESQQGDKFLSYETGYRDISGGESGVSYGKNLCAEDKIHRKQHRPFIFKLAYSNGRWKRACPKCRINYKIGSQIEDLCDSL